MNTNQDSSLISALSSEYSRLEESSMWSSQGQHEQAKRWRTIHNVMGVTTAVASAASACLTFATSELQIYAGILGISAAIGASCLTALNPQGRAEIAGSTANDYWYIQVLARQERQLGIFVKTPDESYEKLLDITDRLNKINHRAGQISRYAYKRAKANIESGGQTYDADVTKDVMQDQDKI